MIRAKLLYGENGKYPLSLFNISVKKIEFTNIENGGFLIGDISINDDKDIVVNCDTILDIDINLVIYNYFFDINSIKCEDEYNIALQLRINNKTMNRMVTDNKFRRVYENLSIRTLEKVNNGDIISVYVICSTDKYKMPDYNLSIIADNNTRIILRN